MPDLSDLEKEVLYRTYQKNAIKGGAEKVSEMAQALTDLERLGSPSESDIQAACDTVESHGFIERAEGSGGGDPEFRITENGRAFFREQDSLLRSSS